MEAAAEQSPTNAERRNPYIRRMAGNLAFALIAEEGCRNSPLMERTSALLGLEANDLGFAMHELCDGGRAQPSSVLGYAPTAGAFPETLFENQLRAEFIGPMADKLEELDVLGLEAASKILDYIPER